MRWRPLLVCLAVAGALAGCGGSSSSSSRTSAAAETADPPAAVPRGWSRVVNRGSGFSLSLPPGWASTRSSTGGTLIRSRDRGLALAVSADRGRDGVRDAPTTYVERTARSLSGYRSLRAGRAVALPGLRYPAAQLTAIGTFRRTGVHQAITLYALRRPGRVTYALAVFRSAPVPSARYAPYLRVILRSFRARPAQSVGRSG
jgi:hypothetical protein